MRRTDQGVSGESRGIRRCSAGRDSGAGCGGGEGGGKGGGKGRVRRGHGLRLVRLDIALAMT